jgi:hypothetical protein
VILTGGNLGRSGVLTGGRLSRAAVAAAGGSSSLLTGLVSYWKMDEASGTRNDSAGTNHLTSNNGVAQVSGKLGNAAGFTAASSQSLSIASNATIQFNDADFTYAGWVWFDDLTVSFQFPFVLGKGPNGSDEVELFIDGGTPTLAWRVNGSALVEKAFSGTGAWLFFEAWHDHTNDLIGININNGTAVTGAFAGGITYSGGALYVGARPNPDLSGRVDGLGLWSRLLTSAERAALYNSGAGIDYPF